MKLTLLDMVTSILSDLDSEPVNSIGDTEEAGQVASVIKDTYYNIIAARHIPEHDRLLKLTSLSDSELPTYFRYPDNVKEIRLFEYDGKEIYWKDPVTFIQQMPNEDTVDTVMMLDPISNTSIYVRNDRAPSYYTTFDDEYIVCDSFDFAVSTTLTKAKTRCWGTQYPNFEITNEFTPDIDDTLFPYLLAESKSVCQSLFKGGSDPKVEQAARRLKGFFQNDFYRTKRENTRNYYGRGSR